MENNPAQEGFVAQVLNDRELVITLGSDDGVRRGMKYAVLAPEPIQVVHPITNETLGTVDREKVRVQAVDVRARYTVCGTYETKTIGGSLYSIGSIADAMNPPRTVPKTFKATEYPEPLSAEDSYVQTGDRVRLLPTDPG